MDARLLSEQDYQELVEIVRWWRSTQKSIRTEAPPPTPVLEFFPEVYLTIGSVASNTTADCEVQALDETGQIEDRGFTIPVYNPSSTDAAGLLVTLRDKWGTWLVIPDASGGGGGSGNPLVWAQITGGSNPYSWFEVADDGTGNFPAVAGGHSGTLNLYEVNSRSTVPTGERVLARLSAHGTWDFWWNSLSITNQTITYTSTTINYTNDVLNLTNNVLNLTNNTWNIAGDTYNYGTILAPVTINFNYGTYTYSSTSSVVNQATNTYTSTYTGTYQAGSTTTYQAGSIISNDSTETYTPSYSGTYPSGSHVTYNTGSVISNSSTETYPSTYNATYQSGSSQTVNQGSETIYQSSSSTNTAPGTLSVPTQTITGAPTWTPDPGTWPEVWVPADKKLWIWDGSAWSDQTSSSSPLTTKGDIWIFNTTDDRFPVGADKLPLVADSTDPDGLKYKILPLEGGGTGIDSSPVTDGQLPIGQTSDHTFALATLTQGAGIAITNAGHSITIAVDTTGTVPHDYSASYTGTTTGTLVTVFNVGDTRGLQGSVGVKNTDGTNFLKLQLTYTDAWGSTTTAAPLILNPGQVYGADINTTAPNKLPVTGLKLEIEDNTPGSHATYSVNLSCLA